LKRKLGGFFSLIRFELPFSAGVCVLLGQLLALGYFPTLGLVFFGFVSVFLISASTLILNDYFDVETDRINAPYRAIPAGLVTRSEVLALFAGVTALGFAASAWISLQALVVGTLVWLVGFLYNWRFKRLGLAGNLMVAFSVGMTFIYGGLTVGLPFEKIVWFFALTVALIDLGEEIANDAMDAEGDRLAGSQSLAIRFGSEAAIRISAAIFFAVVLLSVFPLAMGWMDWVDFLPLLLMDGVILYAIKQFLDPGSPQRRKLLRWVYLSGLGSMLLLIVFRLVR
jgi:geranylgeranylglycerol-phosphate geranylgeranyltransferase